MNICKKLIIVSTALFIMACSSYPEKTKDESTPPDWELLNGQKWDDFVYRLVPSPDEGGNAMNYFIRAINNGFEGEGEYGSKMNYPWWDFVNANHDKFKNKTHKLIVAKAIEIPELDLIVKGSCQKSFQWIGIYSMPSVKPMSMCGARKKPNYSDIMRLTWILEARGYSKLDNGDVEGAETDMIAAFRTGHILQKDFNRTGNMYGNFIEIQIAQDMPEFYKRAGMVKKCNLWESVLPKFEEHYNEYKTALVYMHKAPRERKMAIVNNKQLHRSFRIYCLEEMINDDILATKTSWVFGVSKSVKEFLTTVQFDDPEMTIVQMKLIEDVNIGVYSDFWGRYTLSHF